MAIKGFIFPFFLRQRQEKAQLNKCFNEQVTRVLSLLVFIVEKRKLFLTTFSSREFSAFNSIRMRFDYSIRLGEQIATSGSHKTHRAPNV